MFGIKYIPSKDDEQHEILNVYGVPFELKRGKQFFSIIARMCLSLIAGVVIGVTLIVFVDGLILNVIYLSQNEKCPEDGDMDCYSTSGNNRYFHCNSSEILIPTTLGSVTCYKWFKKGISTLDILEQIGLCAGLIQVFNWVVNLYLRLLLYSYQCPCGSIIICCFRSYLAWTITGFGFSAPIIALVFLRAAEVGITGLTMAVLGCASFIVLMMVILIWALKIHTIGIVAEELSEPTATSESNKAADSAIELQQPSAKTSKNK
ncbi:unnamed protein product [Rotaria magnacalcarata]|uniref:Uncharacterized protein n=1 Tax=Rotaria magnacalcarata TaxID=392030 RepID=A0A819LG25_9BILA|nr:unnamed protein product [Rotaria magnacalcarata]CAF2157884.1 unnamed protein product [Rotaria magnacalcarata]CAF3961237.1 unnamed protein product [Rotaria magnacalcarata]CAF4207328.1 unnamed protein product [Rotaria magnacalcarata]